MIVAIGRNRQIGLNNKMLWHISADFKHFKQTTLGHHMIMGRKTFESIGRPLPGRQTIVLTRDDKFNYPGVLTAKDKGSALELARANEEQEVFIAGGSQIYDLYADVANKIYLSRVDYDGDADCFFPELDLSLWQKTSDQSFAPFDKVPGWSLEVWERS